MVALLVETDDFAAVAWAMSADAGDPLGDALFRLLAALAGCGGMAGSDPTGTTWGRSYDAAASAALVGMRALADASYHLASMFAQTCRNYAAAERACTTDRWAARSAELDIAQLPGETSIDWDVTVPSAVGSSAGGPPGWSLIMGAVGRIWPGGHQDLLHAAAGAWRDAAAAVDAATAAVRAVPGQLAGDRLPEGPAIEAVCQAVTDTGARLAAAMDGLGSHCEDFAAQLDELHAEVEHALADLAGQTIVIEGLGAAASFFSFGSAEGAAQAVESWRVSAVAGRVAALIDVFTAAAQSLGAAITAVTDLAATVSRGLTELLAPRLAIASVNQVRTLPETLATVNGITRTQMAAAEDLGAAGKAAGGSKFSRIAGPLDLEAEETVGGHTLDRHVGKSIDYLKSRDRQKASTFVSRTAAEKWTNATLAENEKEIEAWLAGSKPKLDLDGPIDADAGIIYVRATQSAARPTFTRTVLVRTSSGRGFIVRTSFPDCR